MAPGFGEELMVAVISQHLLASELGQMESQVSTLRAPLGEAEATMRMSLSAAQEQTLADCKHLEATLQAVRCEHTAADAALQSALQAGDDMLREAATRLFLAQDELAAFDANFARKAQRQRLQWQQKTPATTALRQPLDGASPSEATARAAAHSAARAAVDSAAVRGGGSSDPVQVVAVRGEVVAPPATYAAPSPASAVRRATWPPGHTPTRRVTADREARDKASDGGGRARQRVRRELAWSATGEGSGGGEPFSRRR